MKKYKSIISFIVILSFALLSCSCASSNPSKETIPAQNTQAETERDYDIPISTGYSVELKEDGYYYITFEDPEYYVHKLNNKSYVVSVGALSIAELRDKLENGGLSEEDKCAIMVDYDGERTIKLYNFDNIYVPILPPDLCQWSIIMHSSKYYAICAVEKEVAIFKEDGTLDHYATVENIGNGIYNFEFVRKDDYDARYQKNKNYGYTEHEIEQGGKSIKVLYDDKTMILFVSENGIYYYSYMSSYIKEHGGLPSDEWLLSFGVEKYVEPEVSDET